MINVVATVFGVLGAIVIALTLAWFFITRERDKYLRQWHRPDYDGSTRDIRNFNPKGRYGCGVQGVGEPKSNPPRNIPPIRKRYSKPDYDQWSREMYE